MPVELTRVDEFALITLNRPEALNALSFDIVRQIGAAIDDAAAGDARAVFFTGAGERAFCAGADISELMGRSIGDTRDGALLGQATFAKLDALKLPSVAIINGYAFGGGLELAMACTFRLATAAAKFGLPEIKLGLIPGYGGTQRLPRLVGPARALEMVMTGRTVGAQEGLEIGLINRLIDDGDPIAAAIDFARAFSGFSLPALKLAREAVQRAATVPLTEGLTIEADLNTLAFQTADAAEGIAAFLEKRKPAFKDI